MIPQGENNGKFALYSDNGSFVPTLGTITVFENSVSYYMEVVWGGDNNYVITYMTDSKRAVLGKEKLQVLISQMQAVLSV